MRNVITLEIERVCFAVNLFLLFLKVSRHLYNSIHLRIRPAGAHIRAQTSCVRLPRAAHTLSLKFASLCHYALSGRRFFLRNSSAG